MHGVKSFNEFIAIRLFQSLKGKVVHGVFTVTIYEANERFQSLKGKVVHGVSKNTQSDGTQTGRNAQK